MTKLTLDGWARWRFPVALLVAACAIAVLFLTVFVTMVVSLWAVGHVLHARWELWAVVAACASAGALAITVGGGVVVLHQVSEAVHARNLSEFARAFDLLMSDDQIAARRWVYGLPASPAGVMSVISGDAEGQAHVKRVLNAFDYLGFLVQQNWIAADEVIGWVSPIVVKTWSRIGAAVEEEAERRSEPDYYVAARMLAAKCLAWRAKNVGTTEVVWVEKAL